jgi:endonuclease YncB( thermonuclease family)
MRVLVLLLAVGLAGAAVVVARETQDSAEPEVDEAAVDSVRDGDTILLRDGRRVRLLQVDAPELGAGECYARAAQEALRSLAPAGARVLIETDPALDPTDRFGRLLRYVRQVAIDVNLELVRGGAAAPYFFRGERGRFADALVRAARAAQSGRRGLWGRCPATELRPERQVDTGRVPVR